MTKLKTVKKLLYKSEVSKAFLSYVLSAKVAHRPHFSILKFRAAGVTLTELSLCSCYIVCINVMLLCCWINYPTRLCMNVMATEWLLARTELRMPVSR